MAKKIHPSQVQQQKTIKMEIIPLGNVEESKTIEGNYDTNKDTYYEKYDLSPFNIYEFLFLSVNGFMYAHPDAIQYDKNTKILSVCGLKLMDTDQICLACNVLWQD